MKTLYKLPTKNWYLERIVYLLAGIFVSGSVLLALYVSIKFLFLTGLVGAMLIFFALTGWCPMAIFLSKLSIKSKISD